MASKRNAAEVPSRGKDGRTPPPRLRLRLRTADDVQKELGRVYREARAQRLDLATAKTLCYLLATMMTAVQVRELEERIEELEEVDHGGP